MSQPSRADRRRSTRSGEPKHPQKRDPMIAVYIAIGVLIVGVFAAFAITRAYSDHRAAAIVAEEAATPAPLPKPTQKPIVLTGDPKTVIGAAFFQRGDSPAGGQGAQVDGIPCETNEEVVVHFHVHLAIYNHGKQLAVPEFAGMAPSGGSLCLYWLHTHDASGVIHIEAAQAEAPQGGLYTLGTFFDIWGYTLSRTQIASFKGPVTAYVNGAVYTGDLHAIPFTSHAVIALEVGTPLVKPATYIFPPGT
jgi:hypothetical protein